MTNSPLRRFGAAATAILVGAAALVLGAAAPAQAHVTVDPSSTAAGSRAILTFRVPTESDAASTVGIDIHLPTDTPFRSVRVKPVAGWTAEVIESALPAPVTDDDGNTLTTAATEIVWTATDGGLAPDEFGEFEVSVSPLPDTGTVFFPTVQSYSDGSEVGWVQQAEEGSAEPELPAPSVRIGAADASQEAGGHGGHGEAVAAGVSGDPASDSWVVAIGITGLVVALLAAATAAVALARTRR